MGMREWKLIEKTPYGVSDKKTFHSLHTAIIVLVGKLKMLLCEDLIDTGSFVPTQNTFTKEILTKRYVLEIVCPRTTFEIRKQTKGSIDQEEFMAILNRIKEKYCERI